SWRGCRTCASLPPPPPDTTTSTSTRLPPPGCGRHIARATAAREVAEHAIAFVLALLRGIACLDNSVRSGAWDYRLAPPRRVAGAVLGIVGLGRIGREVAGRARALGMRVIAADPAVDEERSAGVAVMPLDELLQAADVVTLHVPLTPATRGMIDAAALSRMQ